MADPVIIEPYDPNWPRHFEAVSTRIAAACGDLIMRIEHVGSTAVPGLAAKPIIDLDVVIADEAGFPPVRMRLEAVGYVYEGDKGIPGREAFNQPPGPIKHHLYVCVQTNTELARHCAFRDALRADPDLVRAYTDLKQSLAERFRDDRAAYSEAKSEFVESVLASLGKV